MAVIRFDVYKEGIAVKQFSIDGVHVFGPDEVPIRGELKTEPGQLIVIRHGEGAIGLSCPWEVVGHGKFKMQTTRLQVRENPYNLNVELARARLLRITQKREEWGMNDLNLTLEQHEKIDQAVELFLEALCSLENGAKASRFADESLRLSLEVGESLAMLHANMFLERRVDTRGLKRHCIGCTFDLQRLNDDVYLDYIKSTFQFVTVNVSWHDIEPKEGEMFYETLDTAIDWLVENRISIKISPLLCFQPEYLPNWLFIWENDFEQVRELAFSYITALVTRYQSKVQAWDIISGLNANNCFKFSFDQILEMTRSCCLAAKKVSNRSLVLIELTEPWGEYFAYNHQAIPPFIYADTIYQSGIAFDGYSIKMAFGASSHGMRTRDLLEISVLLDRFAAFGKPIHLSGVSVPSSYDNSDGGYWHAPWTQDVQSAWVGKFYPIALSKPYVETVTWGSVVDNPGAVLPYGGLLSAKCTVKPAFDLLINLKKKMVK